MWRVMNRFLLCHAFESQKESSELVQSRGIGISYRCEHLYTGPFLDIFYLLFYPLVDCL